MERFYTASEVSFDAFKFVEYNLWPGAAPGEGRYAAKPAFQYWKPEKKTRDSLVIICPGGNYTGLAYVGDVAKYFNSRGITAVVLQYRVPRREGFPKHTAAWQDAQRCVRVCRLYAEDWGIDPNKIGVLGFSAGGHLALMVATSSRTNSYEPVDPVDELPCNVNFAAPVYPAYVLDDGVDGPNVNGGIGAKMVGDFAFDGKTPPMCMIHGDADEVSAMGSVAVYAKLREMNIPAELHIYANLGHGFVGNLTDGHAGDWLNRVYEWMGAVGF